MTNRGPAARRSHSSSSHQSIEHAAPAIRRIAGADSSPNVWTQISTPLASTTCGRSARTTFVWCATESRSSRRPLERARVHPDDLPDVAVKVLEAPSVHAREPLPKEGGTTFTFVTDGVESALAQAREAAGEKDVAIAGGASVIQQVLAAGELDELQVDLAPILLGGGTPLFGSGVDGNVELDSVVDAPGVTHLRYRVLR